jgi:hypothetical protein
MTGATGPTGPDRTAASASRPVPVGSTGPQIGTEPIPTADQLAQPAPRIMLPISFGQWDRLKGRIARLGNPRIDYVNYVVGAWGICIPCAISFLFYMSQHPRSPLTVSLYGSATAGSAAIALLLRHFQHQETEIRTEDATDIIREMTMVEEAHLRGESPSR